MADGKEGNDTKADKAPAGGVQYQFAIKPEEKPGWEGFKEFIFTCAGWLKHAGKCILIVQWSYYIYLNLLVQK